MTEVPVYGYRQPAVRRQCSLCKRDFPVTPVTGVYRSHHNTDGEHCPMSGQPAWKEAEPL